ncbi:DUF3137 domain-containing protein [Novosphingobium sp. TH158]|uniref:DUF3137 domain-containing protein n=1 Tax=Novosphingobium sp. TH158 TaxID=2067455 RepID=UPI000C7D7B89|nr:DUF3137 domain-containing protein [Novosphingobium sp. TH158]PLK26225.1 hypothetical protein C0V78_04495 [Novosphingobium sp. TH158]
MIVRPDPDSLMAGELGQWLATQDGDRAAARARAAAIQKWAIIAACVVAVLIVLFNGQVSAALQGGFFVGAGGFGIAEYSKRKVTNTIKGGINGAIARSLGMEYAVEVSPGGEFDLARSFDMLPGHDRASFEDLWRGTLGQQEFMLYQARLEEKRSSGKSSHWVTVFNGSLMQIGLTRRFHGVTLIERAGRRQSFFGLLGDKDEIELGGVQLARIDLVDPRFQDLFAVWSNDPVEARYLVHPEYVERLLAVEAAFAGEKVRALFIEGRMLILLESGNLFESGSLEANHDRMLLEQTIDQFGTLADLAVQLNERPR